MTARADSPAADVAGESESRTVIRLHTVNGSVYEIDLGMMVWRRVGRTDRSGELRSEGGEVIAMARLRVGSSAAVLFAPFDSGVARILLTSPIVRIDTRDAKKDG